MFDHRSNLGLTEQYTIQCPVTCPAQMRHCNRQSWRVQFSLARAKKPPAQGLPAASQETCTAAAAAAPTAPTASRSTEPMIALSPGQEERQALVSDKAAAVHASNSILDAMSRDEVCVHLLRQHLDRVAMAMLACSCCHCHLQQHRQPPRAGCDQHCC